MPAETQIIYPAAEVAEQYAKGALEGTIPACNFIKLACERHVRDMHRAAIGDVTFPYYYDRAAGQHVVDFCQLLQPSKGEWAGLPLKLLSWQIFVIFELFAWKRNEDGTRRRRFAYICIPRKQGKSTLLAAIGLYMLCCDDAGAEVYTAATTKEQARQIYDEAVAMRDNTLKKFVKKVVNTLYIPTTKSKFKPLAADSSKMDGLNCSCALLDEIHEHPDARVYEKLRTSTGARRQPLLIMITTAGVGHTSFCYKQQLTSERILKSDLDNESFFAFIAAIDDPTKWQDEAEWYKCNPSLGQTLKIAVLRDDYLLARNNPDELNSFLRYHLCCWTDSLRVWMPMDKWAQAANVGSDKEFPDAKKLRSELMEKLKGRVCCGGLDLSATIDLTAFCLVFPPMMEVTGPDPKDKSKQIVITPADPNYYCLPFFWVPEETVTQRSTQDHVSYDTWVRGGFIETTRGSAVDYVPVRDRILDLAKLYDIREIAFDDWGSQEIVQFLQGEGFTVANFRQGFRSMSDPMKGLLKHVLTGKFVHGANPVLRWNAANVVAETDAAGNIKASKEKSAEKIDGIVATIMALARAEMNKDVGSPEFFTL